VATALVAALADIAQPTGGEHEQASDGIGIAGLTRPEGGRMSCKDFVACWLVGIEPPSVGLGERPLGTFSNHSRKR